MFTICPNCTKQFQIYAEHISAASGEVRCGFCNTQFNALEHLHDQPLSNEGIQSSLNPPPEPGPKLGRELLVEPASDVLEEDEPEFKDPDNGLLNTINEANSEQIFADEPEFDISESDAFENMSPDSGLLNTIDEGNSEAVLAAEPENIELEQAAQAEPEQDIVIANDDGDSSQELDRAINEIGVPEVVEDEEVTIRREIVEDDAPEKIDIYVSESEYHFPEPDDLLVETPVKRSWVSSLFWTSACLVGIITISSQLVWFNRDQVVLKYPEIIPYLKQVCNELDCRIIRQRDTSAITLINRDVRLHPSYQDTLLVNATMSNDLSIHQPYPRVQLTLFDTAGSLLGHREFNPDDYLDDSIDIDEGMPVKIPVHFVLEVSGPTAGAVSFEFRFL